ncbi:hypothetical protein AKO1_007539 [Acrasis kona]|uniref:Uncharacterized protein n=1 Tax=Acrasis kona TaxID=1008807 RepID=A0AAW2YQV6_9EUKA
MVSNDDESVIDTEKIEQQPIIIKTTSFVEQIPIVEQLISIVPTSSRDDEPGGPPQKRIEKSPRLSNKQSEHVQEKPTGDTKPSSVPIATSNVAPVVVDSIPITVPTISIHDEIVKEEKPKLSPKRNVEIVAATIEKPVEPIQTSNVQTTTNTTPSTNQRKLSPKRTPETPDQIRIRLKQEEDMRRLEERLNRQKRLEQEEKSDSQVEQIVLQRRKEEEERRRQNEENIKAANNVPVQQPMAKQVIEELSPWQRELKNRQNKNFVAIKEIDSLSTLSRQTSDESLEVSRKRVSVMLQRFEQVEKNAQEQQIRSIKKHSSPRLNNTPPK